MEQDTDDYKEKYHQLLWRLAAVVHLSVWTTKGILRFLVFQQHLNAQAVFPVSAYLVFYSATILAAAVLIFRPLKFRIYIGVFFTWALIHFIEKRSVIGIVEYALAGMFAWHAGFFKTWLRVKMGVFLGIVLAALVVEVGARFSFTGTIVLWCLEFFLAVGLGMALFLAEFIQKPRVPALTDERKSVGMLLARGISTDEIDILRRILKKEKYESIADSYGESLSTFKRRIHQLFVKTGAADHDDFCRQYGDDDNPDLPAAEPVSVQ